MLEANNSEAVHVMKFYIKTKEFSLKKIVVYGKLIIYVKKNNMFNFFSATRFRIVLFAGP